MGEQLFKSVYFPDFQIPHTDRRSFKIAFGKRDAGIFDSVGGLSSNEIRTILRHNSYAELRAAAGNEGLSLNTFCLRNLRQWFASRQGNGTKLLFPDLEIDPLHGTFRGAKSAPLQRWYPFLEGYSPRFVEEILARFAPQARTVLDPFGGTGTTPLTVARHGYKAYYCELNPLLQFLTDAKIRALTLPTRDRGRIVLALETLASTLPASIARCEPDSALRAAFQEVFGASAFFSAEAYNWVLRTRTLLDQLIWMDPFLGQFALVAALACMIPCSNLRRAGDLRFRRGVEFDDIAEFLPTFQSQLKIVAEDLATAEQIQVVPTLVCGDSKGLGVLEPLDVDTVITSPPYLNGTNYFRNTKVELWFLRSIRKGGDLARFRRLAVTAGINDVTRHKSGSNNEEVVKLVEELEKEAYDRRIPQMVSSYFYDMAACLSAVASHLSRDAVVALDIGDSSYAGIHVPTDRLMVEIAKPIGLELLQSVPLRSRVSRDSTPLHQVLLVFRLNPRVRYGEKKTSLHRNSPVKWDLFKASLPHQAPPFTKRNWGHTLHSLCSYQGKMKPSLAHFLTGIFVRPGGRVLDPFAGVGTIPFEAALQGAKAYGFEISPAAFVIAASKLGRASQGEIETVVKRLEDFLQLEKTSKAEHQNAEQIRFNGGIEKYFHPRTFKEILLARRFFALNPPKSASGFLVMSAMLHILHGNRPYALSRRSHPITPFSPTGPTEYKSLIPHLLRKIERSLETALPAGFSEGRMFECDATSWWPREVEDLDAIITSPPFFDSTRFYLTNWMRLWFSGWERTDFDARPRSFVDEKQKTNFRVYESIFRQARERLRKDGLFVLHLGRSVKCDMSKQMEDVARPWFRVVDRFSENVTHCESHGIRDKGTVTAHQFLILQ